MPGEIGVPWTVYSCGTTLRHPFKNICLIFILEEGLGTTWGIAEKEGYLVAEPTLTSIVRGFSSGPKLRCLP